MSQIHLNKEVTINNTVLVVLDQYVEVVKCETGTSVCNIQLPTKLAGSAWYGHEIEIIDVDGNASANRINITVNGADGTTIRGGVVTTLTVDSQRVVVKLFADDDWNYSYNSDDDITVVVGSITGPVDGEYTFLDGIGGSYAIDTNADSNPYDNTISGLSATDVKAAIDELTASIVAPVGGNTSVLTDNADGTYEHSDGNIPTLVTISTIANTNPYTPAVSGDWSPVPTEVAGALDQLAAVQHAAVTALSPQTDEITVIVSATQELSATITLDGVTGGGNNAAVITAGQGLYVAPAGETTTTVAAMVAGVYVYTNEVAAAANIDVNANVLPYDPSGVYLVATTVQTAIDELAGDIHDAVTVGDTDNIDITLATQHITADVILDPSGDNILTTSASGLLVDGSAGENFANTDLILDADRDHDLNGFYASIGTGVTSVLVDELNDRVFLKTTNVEIDLDGVIATITSDDTTLIGKTANAPKLNFTDDAGGETVSIQAPSAVSASYDLFFPTAQAPNANETLLNDAAGNLSWGRQPFLRGQTHYVDSVYGDDTTAALHPYDFAYPWKTIEAAYDYALASGADGDAILISAGLYEPHKGLTEWITIENTKDIFFYALDGVTIKKEEGTAGAYYDIFRIDDGATFSFRGNATFTGHGHVFQSSSTGATTITIDFECDEVINTATDGTLIYYNTEFARMQGMKGNIRIYRITNAQIVVKYYSDIYFECDEILMTAEGGVSGARYALFFRDYETYISGHDGLKSRFTLTGRSQPRCQVRCTNYTNHSASDYVIYSKTSAIHAGTSDPVNERVINIYADIYQEGDAQVFYMQEGTVHYYGNITSTSTGGEPIHLVTSAGATNERLDFTHHEGTVIVENTSHPAVKCDHFGIARFYGDYEASTTSTAAITVIGRSDHTKFVFGGKVKNTGPCITLDKNGSTDFPMYFEDCVLECTTPATYYAIEGLDGTPEDIYVTGEIFTNAATPLNNITDVLTGRVIQNDDIEVFIRDYWYTNPV